MVLYLYAHKYGKWYSFSLSQICFVSTMWCEIRVALVTPALHQGKAESYKMMSFDELEIVKIDVTRQIKYLKAKIYLSSR